MQALDRTQPSLPLKKGRAATRTHDYKRHGTTTLFAALSTPDGSLISFCKQRHRHEEWLIVLRQNESGYAQGQGSASDLRQLRHTQVRHTQASQCSSIARQAPALSHALHADFSVVAEHGQALLSRLEHPRLERGVFRSVSELTAAIKDRVAVHNKNPKTFIWTVKAADILQDIIPVNRRLGSKQNETLH